MDDGFNNAEDPNRVDHLVPESGPGESAANFSAKKAQQEQFLGGGGPKSPELQSQQKESEWPMGVRKSIEVDGRKWQYLEYGNPDGQPLLNIHGWLGSSAEGQDHLSRAFTGELQNSEGFKKVSEYHDATSDNPVAKIIKKKLETLQGKYHVIAPDLPGFGNTEALDKVSLDRLTDEIAAFQKAIGLGKARVFGASMGGILAVKLAARHPEAVEAIVLQGTMTRSKDMQKVPYFAAQVATLPPIPNILKKTGLDKKLFEGIVKGSKDFKLADKETQDRVIRDTYAADSATSAKTLREIGRDIGGDIEATKCPVIVIDGANGDLVPIAKSLEVSKRFDKTPEKRAMFFPVGGGVTEQGHNLVNTYPEYVAIVVDSALSRISS